MNAARFDTLKLAKSLEDASFTPEQAEGIVRTIATALRSDLATRADLDGLRMDIRADGAWIRSEIRAMTADLIWSHRMLACIQTIVVLGGLVGAVVALLHPH